MKYPYTGILVRVNGSRTQLWLRETKLHWVSSGGVKYSKKHGFPAKVEWPESHLDLATIKRPVEKPDTKTSVLTISDTMKILDQYINDLDKKGINPIGLCNVLRFIQNLDKKLEELKNKYSME